MAFLSVTERRAQQGQLGLQRSGKDSEQLSWQSDRELKMEEEDACGRAHGRQERAGAPVTLTVGHKPLPHDSAWRSGGDERVVLGDAVEGQRGRNGGALQNLAKSLTKESKFQGEGTDAARTRPRCQKLGRGSGAPVKKRLSRSEWDTCRGRACGYRGTSQIKLGPWSPGVAVH
jgi:hypothetical protein